MAALTQKEFAELVNQSISGACRNDPHHGEEIKIILPASSSEKYNGDGILLDNVKVMRLDATILRDTDGTDVFDLKTMGTDFALYEVTGNVR